MSISHLFPRTRSCLINQVRHHYRETPHVSYIVKFFPSNFAQSLQSLQSVYSSPFPHLVLFHEVVQGREKGRVPKIEEAVSAIRATGTATYPIIAVTG